MLVRKTQFGKICSQSINFVTPYFSWKIFSQHLFYYGSPVKLVPYKDTGCVWILGIGYFLPACSVAIMPPVLWPTRAIENTITKVLSEKCIQKCWKWSIWVLVYSLTYYDVKFLCNFILVINVVIHWGKITKFRNLYKEQRINITLFYITEVQQQRFYFFLRWAHACPPSLYEPEMIKPLTKRVIIYQK